MSMENELRRWAPYGLLVAVAVAVRWFLVGVPPDGSESMHYAVARAFGQEEPTVSGLYPWYWFLLRPFLWARPAFYAVLWAPSQVSFELARVVSLCIAALVAPLMFGVLRRLGAGWLLGSTAGLVAALHPAFVVTGARIEPIQWMAVALLGAVLAQLQGRGVLAAVLAAAAIGCDRLALFGAAGLLGVSIMQARRAGTFRAWPLRADQGVSAQVLVVALAPFPLVYSAVPTFGLFGPADANLVLQRVFWGAWLAVPVLVGLAWRRTRTWSLLALVYPAAYLLALRFLDRTATAEQALPALTLSLVATWLVVDEAIARVPRPGVVPVARVAAVLFAMLLVTPAFVSLGPLLDPARSPTLSASREASEARRTWMEASTWLEGAGGVVLVDIPFDSIYYPFHEAAGGVETRFLFSSSPENLRRWSELVAENGTRTLLIKNDQPLNRAVRDVYADCVQRDENGFVLIVGAACSGRAELLHAKTLGFAKDGSAS